MQSHNTIHYAFSHANPVVDACFLMYVILWLKERGASIEKMSLHIMGSGGGWWTAVSLAS